MTLSSSLSSLTLGLALAASLPTNAAAEEIKRIWLTHAAPTPATLTVNWETEKPGESVVEFGATLEATGGVSRAETGTAQQVEIPLGVIRGEIGTLHRVEIPLPAKGVLYYRVRSGEDASRVYRLVDRSTEEFRAVLIGNVGYTKASWSEAILKERPHLLLTAGDNVPQLHTGGSKVAPDDISAFRRLIDAHPELFSTTPFLPALGNHDRELRPRGPKPPEEAVYDIEATAFRKFFALPGDEWKWTFTLPEFGVRFAALDLNHLQDFGTTWQTSHPFQRNSEQFSWYRELTESSREPFLITIYNEKNSHVRSLEGGEWGRMIRRGSVALSGFGYFGERAEADGCTWYNTSLNGTGDRYPDPKSAALHSANNYLLLTFRPGGNEFTIELKDLAGAVLDRKTFTPRVTESK